MAAFATSREPKINGRGFARPAPTCLSFAPRDNIIKNIGFQIWEVGVLIKQGWKRGNENKEMTVGLDKNCFLFYLHFFSFMLTIFTNFLPIFVKEIPIFL